MYDTRGTRVPGRISCGGELLSDIFRFVWRRVSLFVGIALAIGFGAAAGCEDETDGAGLPRRTVVPSLAGDSAVTPTRSFAMGWGFTPPVPSVEAVIDIIPRIATVSEYTIIQREVPWGRLTAGASIEQVLDEDWDGLVDFLRGNGLKLVILIDPLDGLDRTREGDEARESGVSLRDATARATHEAFVVEVARRYQPEYLGLASEINTLAAHGDGQLYAILKDMINGLLPGIRAVSPGSKLFVSHQVDDAWGLSGRPSSVADQFKLVHDFPGTDVVGLSSYPVFFWDRPEDIPTGYYERYVTESGKPVVQVEGGWSSERTQWMAATREASEAAQARYFQRLWQLLEEVDAELLVLLTYADLDLARPEWALSEDNRTGLLNFARMGIVDTGLTPKPSFALWDSMFKRPIR